ncbi:MAG TPA: malto-oligosyltrehalose trehalohydrolase [Pseudolysinimonas sp.]|nr:malto-oligosyltrehalose trehalohydrolase [Pseudolysinimonas sp.]
MARVWAPHATRVRLLSDGAERELAPDPHGTGWWSDDRELATGARYGFLLDDATDPLPDPRGLRLPDGVHGLSQVVDPGLFGRTHPSWSGRELAGSVIYELHIGTYTPAGTLNSAIARLDHLVHLGVDFVELLPVNSFNGAHNWGYDGVAWFAVDETYGGPEAYARFVDACHDRNLAVLQDVVYNHLGPSGNYLPHFGPYLADEGGNTWGSNVNLGDPEVRRYILDNAQLWMRDYGVDGLRLDAVHALVDTTPTHLLAELAEETAELETRVGRPLTLIAESDLNDPVMFLPAERNGHGLTAQWNDDYHHAVHVALTGETHGYYEDFASLAALAKAATSGFVHDGGYSTFRGREHGAPIPSDVEPWRLVTFSQDHDQIGNRAAGDRLTHGLSPERLAIGALLTVASPFTPMLFMGEEWAASTPWQFFTAHPEPELGEAVATGRIREFARMGWDREVVPDPQDPATFERSQLDWSELTEQPHARILSLYRELIALRRRESAWTLATFRDLSADYDDEAGRFRLHIGELQVAVNLGSGTWDVAGSELLLATSERVTARPLGVRLPPDTGAILRT